GQADPIQERRRRRAPEIGGQVGPPLPGAADLGPELRRVELLLPPVEAVIGAEVELFPALVLVEAGVELRRDHRLRRPAPEELVTPLAVEDGREPGLAGGAPEEIVWPRHR